MKGFIYRSPLGLPLTDCDIRAVINNASYKRKITQFQFWKEELLRAFDETEVTDIKINKKSIKRVAFNPDFYRSFFSHPEHREAIAMELDSHLDDIFLPEWNILNRFCSSKYGMPYFKVNSANNKNYAEQERSWVVSIVQSEEFKSLPDKLKCGCFMTATVQPIEAYEFAKLDESFTLLPAIYSDIIKGVAKDIHFKAIWAISSCYTTPIPILALLAYDQDYIKHFPYLEWFGDNEEGVYQHELNLLNAKSDIVPLFMLKSSTLFIQHMARDASESLKRMSSTGDTRESLKSAIEMFTPMVEIVSINQQNIKMLILARLKMLEDDFNEDVERIRSLSKGVLSPQTLESYLQGFFGKEFKTHEYFSHLSESNISDSNEKLTLIEIDKRIQSSISFVRGRLDSLILLLHEFESIEAEPLKHLDKLKELTEELDEFKSNFTSQLDNHMLDVSELVSDFTSVKESELEQDSSENLDPDAPEILRLQEELKHQKSKNHILNLKLESISNQEDNTPEVSDDEDLIKKLLDGEITNIQFAVLQIERKHPGVKVLPSAIKSLAKMDAFKNKSRVISLIKTLASDYFDSIKKGQPDSQARLCFPKNVYRANESENVSNNSELMKHRTFKYNGENIEMQQHLGIGAAHNTRETARIYFKIVNNELLIGHIGHHLPL